MRIFGMIVLSLVALFCGGCALLGWAEILQTGLGDPSGLGSVIFWFSAVGTVVAGLCIWAVRRLSRS